MSKITQNRIVDPVLTTLARGYKNSAFVGENLFPTVMVDKETGRIPLFGKDAFKVYNTKRAPTAASNVRTIDGVHNIRFVLDEHDLVTPVDYREEKEAAYSLEARATAVNQASIELEMEVHAANYAQDIAAYHTNNKLQMTSGDYFDESGGDPEAVISDSIETLRSIIGVRPNVCVIGGKVFKGLKKSPKLKTALQYATGGVIGLAQLKQQFQLDNIVVGEAVYANASDGAFGDVWGNNIILAYVAPQAADTRNPNEPSFGYRLRVKGQPVVDKIEMNPGKVYGVRNTDITNVFRTGVVNTGTESSPTWVIESAYIIYDCVTP